MRAQWRAAGTEPQVPERLNIQDRSRNGFVYAYCCWLTLMEVLVVIEIDQGMKDSAFSLPLLYPETGGYFRSAFVCFFRVFF